MQIRYAVEDLICGMYVSELDRPWDDTSFLFQGFMIETKGDLSEVQKACKFVYVDNLKSSLEVTVQDKLYAALPHEMIEVMDALESQITPELHAAIEKIELDATAFVDRLKQLVEAGSNSGGLESDGMREAVTCLIDDIAANPHASAWLRLLGNQDEDDSRNGISSAILAMGFARHLGWDAELQRIVGQGAIFHDIGLMKVDRELRYKREPLTAVEERVLTYHPTYGVSLLQSAGGLDARVLKIVQQHHEHLDGSGFPAGASGTDVEIYSQLVALCDLYDHALYRRRDHGPLVDLIPLNELRRKAGIFFDSELTWQFVKYIGIYPLGALVKLHNGVLAIVVRTDEAHRLRPTVLLIREADGSPILPPRTLDIEIAERIGKYQEWRVESVMDPAAENIDVAAILRSEIARL